MRQPDVILLGGFLGAGKTTLIAVLLEHFRKAGRKAGVVTNDQAANLVDTGLLQTQTSAVREVAGSCFCCSFTDFAAELKDLRKQLDPEILIGEPVGSCTDLSGTVVQPLKKLYQQEFRILPYCVLVDPMRWRHSLLPRDQRRFPDDVLYIYRLQIEEADAIVLSKCDLLSREELAELKAELEKRYPGRPVFAVSALTGQGVDQWVEFLLSGKPAGQRIAEVDYDTYAHGEALLGWLNASVQLEGPANWAQFAKSLLGELQSRLGAQSAEIAHAKLLLTGGDSGGVLAGNLTSNTSEVSVRGEVPLATSRVDLILNVRAHVAPDILQQTVETSLRSAAGEDIRESIKEIRSLSPGRPNPTYRFSEVVETANSCCG